MNSRSTKFATQPEEAPLADRIRQILSFSLCVESVRDDDLLTLWSSLDLVEAIICCERELKIPEIDDEQLLKCSTAGALVKVINAASCDRAH